VRTRTRITDTDFGSEEMRQLSEVCALGAFLIILAAEYASHDSYHRYTLRRLVRSSSDCYASVGDLPQEAFCLRAVRVRVHASVRDHILKVVNLTNR